MFSETKRLVHRPISRRRAVGLAALAGLATLLISGLCAPTGGRPTAQAAPPAARSPAAPAEAKAIDLRYVPSSAIALFAVRPAALLSKDEMQPLVKLLNEAIGLESKTSLTLEKVEEVKVAINRPAGNEKRGLEGGTLIIVRYAEPFDWKAQFGEKLVGQPVEASVAGKTYYHAGDGEQATRAFYLPDERTVVFGPEGHLRRSILSAAKPVWAVDWEQSATGAVAAFIDVEAFSRYMDIAKGSQKPEPAAAFTLAAFSPLWEKSRRLFASVNADHGMVLTTQLECASGEDAERVRDTFQAVLTLVRNVLDEGERYAAQETPAEAEAIITLIDLARTFLNEGTLTVDDHKVQYVSVLDLDAAETAISIVVPAILAAREAGQKNASKNNLFQIGLGIQTYNDVNRHFPAPVLLGPDGKTPHSWRVAILPYVEQKELYKQYKMDEPWDSENNKKVLAQMPAMFHNPQADSTKFETSYFALVGPATALGPKGSKGTKMQDITDGTSNTIALVEAKRPVPWTKPEDIDFDPAKPLPRLGGWSRGGFWAVFCDGHMDFIRDSIDPKTLRALITKAGGEPIDYDY